MEDQASKNICAAQIGLDGIKNNNDRKLCGSERGAGSGKSWRKGDIRSTFTQNSQRTEIKYAV